VSKELTPKDLSTRRLRSCVMAFPRAETGEHNPRCCRFPKPCNPYGTVEAYQAGNIAERDLESPENAPVRFERQTSPVGDTPIPRRRDESVYQAEQKKLRQMRVGSSFVSSMREEVDPYVQLEKDRQVHRLEAMVLQEHLADDHYEEILVVTQPKTWWDHFKIDHLDSWWGRWLNTHFPSEYNSENHLVRVKIERYASYPEADVAVPQLGRPIPFETLKRLTPEEVEDQEIQKQLEEEAEDKKQLITVYSLVPETFDDLAEETGLDRNWFESAYKYDQDFDLQSKIYIIPENFGYNQKES